MVAVPVNATLMAVAPAEVPAAAVIVKPAELVVPLPTSTVLGAKVIPVAVGVSVMAAPAAATSKLKVTLELATPPSTMEVSADSVTVLGPSTTVSLLVASVAIVRGVLPMLVAVPVNAMLMAVTPAEMRAAAVTVKPAELVVPLSTSTLLGAKVIPVAVGGERDGSCSFQCWWPCR